MSGETVIEGAGLQVVFTRVGDRLTHVIGLLDGARFLPLLTSVEGTADDDWPASPPLQSLHLDERSDGRRLALLVGMAGRSHWSMSLELDPSQGRLTCDVACRLHAEPTALTSAYQIDVAAQPISTADQSLRFGGAAHVWELRTEGTDSPPCSLQAAGPSLLTIRCHAHAGPLPRTARWRYSLSRAQGAG